MPVEAIRSFFVQKFERYLHYVDIHSHNSMPAKFSPVDDQDEQATRIYIVLGRLDKFFPDMTVRMSCGGTFCELDPSQIFEDLGKMFPLEWCSNVKYGACSSNDGAKARLLEALDTDSFWGGKP